MADLKQKGAVALDVDELKALIVGKTVTLRNVVTGQLMDILYGEDGRRLLISRGGQAPTAGNMYDLMHVGELSSPTQYEIKDGRIMTIINDTPFTATLYKVGDKYVAARSNEFGFANYEVVEIR